MTELKGVDELLAKLQTITYETQRKTGRAALRKASSIVRDAAITNAANIDNAATRENISKNIRLQWNNRQFKRTGNLGFRVGVLGGAKRVAKAVGEMQGKGKANPGGDTYYWRFLEFGTKYIAAIPFLRPALEQNTQKATDAFIEQYKKGIDSAVKRAAKRGTTA